MRLPTKAVRKFQVLIRKCQNQRPRAPDPPVRVSVIDEQFLVIAQSPQAFLELSILAEGMANTEPVFVSLRELDRPIEQVASTDSGEPTFEDIRYPKKWKEMPEDFLPAVREACFTAAVEDHRYALRNIQFRGKLGTVIGTDGLQALVQRGFKFPFREDVLVPALPILRSKELATQPKIELAKTPTHLVIRAGPWTLGLSIDKEGRFPPVEDAIPRSSRATELEIDDMDAIRLADFLTVLPAESERSQSVVIELDGSLGIRGWNQKLGRNIRFPLKDSRRMGKPIRIGVRCRDLERVLRLGFRHLTFIRDDRSWSATDGRRIFFAAPIDLKAIDQASDVTESKPPLLEKEQAVTTLPSFNGRELHEQNTPESDLLSEAESLRVLLGDVLSRLGRHIAQLRSLSLPTRADCNALAAFPPLHLK